MSRQQDLLILANSRKHGGRCVAGVSLDSGQWVRPVSADEDGTLDESHYCPPSLGRPLRPLDVAGVPVGRACPAEHQPENVLTRSGWRYKRTLGPEEARPYLKRLAGARRGLLTDRSDRIPASTVRRYPISRSLSLSRPTAAVWEVAYRRRRQVRCKFDVDPEFSRLEEWQFDLAVTDPEWEELLEDYPLGTYTLEDAGMDIRSELYLTISLGEPYRGNYYKLIAGVILLPPEG